MFDAREWLAGVSEAARIVEHEAQWEEAQRYAAIRISAPLGIAGKSSNSNVMAVVDNLIDTEKTRKDRIGYAIEELVNAHSVFEGMRTIGMYERSAADVLELVHVGLVTKKDAAKALYMSYSTVKARYCFGVDWLNAHGLAHAKAGVGLAAI